jgi:hypothetical protein
MPEQDFELYLSLLSRFLRLNPAQRDEIADELRDHLEQRLEELAARGVPRDKAIRQALDEFGNAAELAEHFTRAAHIRRRRLIMRCTFGTVGALAASLLVAMAFWPQNAHIAQAPLPRMGVANETNDRFVEESVQEETLAGPEKAQPPAVPADDPRAQVAVKLETRIDVGGMSEQPLEKVVETIGDLVGVDILFDVQALTDEGTAIDSSIRKLKITHTQLTARGALELILEPLKLGFTIRDGIVLVTTTTKLSEQLEIRMYNVRDLLEPERHETARADAGEGAGEGFFSVESAVTAIAAAQVGQLGNHEPAARGGSGSLIQVMTRSIDPDTWDEVGGPGSIVTYNGLLVVRQTSAVHAKVEKFLEMMRRALRERAATKK